MFINAFQKIFVCDDLKKENLIRYDYITQTVISLIENININDNLKWISYEQYIEFNKQVKYIKENSEDFKDENKLNNSIESNDDESDNLENTNDLEKENNSFDSNIEIDNLKNIIDLVEINDSIKSSEKKRN